MKQRKIVIAVSLALSLAQQSVDAQFDPVFQLSDLNGQNGITVNGVATGDKSGRSVSRAGDVNGDGIDDFIIGADGVGSVGNRDVGSSYVVFGTDIGFPNPFSLASLNGSNGFTINGISAKDYSGFSVSDAGDVNGDGIDDVIIGAYRADPGGISNAGSSYVVYGSANGLPSTINLININGINGFVINGAAAEDRSGRSVSSAGDFNGDGIGDIVIGATGASTGGSSYVVFGSDSGLPNPLNLANLDGINGFVINGDAASGFGSSVSSAGDFNGDGVDDLIIGAVGADSGSNISTGSSYVVFGSNQNQFPNPLNVNSLDGQNGIVINGTAQLDYSGGSVSGAGDINGDGFDDLIIGAHGADPFGIYNSGASYVVFGSSIGLPNPFDLADINGINGFVINGQAEQDESGRSVSGAGDINGDGVDDLIVGARLADANGNLYSGKSYVIYGAVSSQFPSPLNLSTLDGQNGFVLNGAAAVDQTGRSVSGAGDVNGDGIADLIISAIGADPNGNDYAGSSYVVFGNDGIFSDGFE